MSLTAVVITKNEEDKIVDCLESLNFCNEVLVIDDYSTDRTIEVVQNLSENKIKVKKRKLLGNFAAQRNFGLEMANGNWVLFIDADEIVSQALRDEIIEVTKKNSAVAGYKIRRVDVLFGKKIIHGEIADIVPVRLVQKGKGKWKGKVHEVLEIEGEVALLRTELLHYPHKTIAEFVSDINEYTTIRSRELFDAKRPVNIFAIISFPVGKFLYTYLYKKGFSDGMHGFFLSSMMSWHSFLVRAKLWQLYRSK